jgi:hypothetical protein
MVPLIREEVRSHAGFPAKLVNMAVYDVMGQNRRRTSDLSV